ncbi:ran-interacting Mog1 protein [Apiospora arundinis]
MSRPAAGCGLSGTLDLERELPFNWKQAIGNWATKPIPRKLHSIESPNHTKSKPHIFQSHPRGRQIPVIMPQDMPPVGGYGPVQYKRNLPAPGFKPAALVIGMGAVCVWGFYKLGQGIREQNELAREKMWSRIHLIPLLQAEEDRDLARRHMADQAREKQLTGDNFKVYNSDRYVRPTYAVTPANTTK